MSRCFLSTPKMVCLCMCPLCMFIVLLSDRSAVRKSVTACCTFSHVFIDTIFFPSVFQHCQQARHCSTTRSSPWSETLKSHWICTKKNCVKKEPRLDWPAVGKCLATRKSAPKVRLRTYFGFFDAFCCTRLCCFCAYSAVTRLHTFVG